ncbi:M28 family peptidase [Pontimicrobium aquaticum]|uniref:Carboxypeptidase Q n=1 Tax=Pontimicrobium aquaticum TaxID=2565367 RepID=A0A4U0EQL5_9FLAO|nr:M28 family peptidase [Pontimicrobium aquaticum]TJY33983.1 M20/M25/M40 family metallo-hydrolase [Pontimicrobium aquaticum]
MKLKHILFIVAFIGLFTNGFTQSNQDEKILAQIRTEGFLNTQAMSMLQELSDVYGQRLTGSREYFSAATWISNKMKTLGLQNVHFENYCDNCRGWSMKSFNVEMTSPNFMHINAYPLAMSKSSNGTVEGELVHIKSFRDMDAVRQQYGGNLQGKVVLLGTEPRKASLTESVSKRYSEEELEKMESKLVPQTKQTPLPELFEGWKTSDVYDKEFLEFVEAEGALAVLKSRSILLGILHPDGTYYYQTGALKPLPYFTIMPEHFGRLARMIKLGVTPKIKLNLDTEFYNEQENNVNIIGELTGTDAKLKSETILIGAHFDSWHSGTGATDNGANSVVLVEALRILKAIEYKPKRTLRMGLWGGEEQAFLGSAAYARQHFGELNEKPNKASKKISAYLNLDNGAGAIRGLYLQKNELARPVFENVFEPIDNLSEGALTIENTLSTDHETFDHYNIPSFQFVQDELAYGNVTHHTQLDVLEYVPEEDIMKNAVILAWTIYKLSENDVMVPRKVRD